MTSDVARTRSIPGKAASNHRGARLRPWKADRAFEFAVGTEEGESHSPQVVDGHPPVPHDGEPQRRRGVASELPGALPFSHELPYQVGLQVDDINPHCLRVEDVEVAGTVEADAGNVAEGVWPSVDNMHTLAIDWEMNPDFDWNVEKNQRLVEQRGISFERVVSAIEQDGLVDILEHPNQERYAGQMIYVVDVEQYLYLVPFVTSADGTRFLKMIIPSRKATRHYRKRRSS